MEQESKSQNAERTNWLDFKEDLTVDINESKFSGGARRAPLYPSTPHSVRSPIRSSPIREKLRDIERLSMAEKGLDFFCPKWIKDELAQVMYGSGGGREHIQSVHKYDTSGRDFLVKMYSTPKSADEEITLRDSLLFGKYLRYRLISRTIAGTLLMFLIQLFWFIYVLLFRHENSTSRNSLILVFTCVSISCVGVLFLLQNAKSKNGMAFIGNCALFLIYVSSTCDHIFYGAEESSLKIYFAIIPILLVFVEVKTQWINRWVLLCLLQYMIMFILYNWTQNLYHYPLSTIVRDSNPAPIAGYLSMFALFITTFVLFNVAITFKSYSKLNLEVLQDILKHLKIQEREANDARSVAEFHSNMKSEFLATVAHEIRTPLNGVIGMTDIVLQGELSAEQRENLDIVKSSGISLLVLLNDILDLSKIEAGKLKVENINFCLPTILIHCVKALGVISRDKGVTLFLDIVPGLPLVISGDPTRYRQVVINLVGNAIKFTKKGGNIVVTVSVRNVNKIDQIHICVSDTGIGIPKVRQDLIFEKFGQADETVVRKYGGTGLGLSISRMLCSLMGGNMWVESYSEDEYPSTSDLTFKFPCRRIQNHNVRTNFHVLLPNTEVDEAIYSKEDDLELLELLSYTVGIKEYLLCKPVIKFQTAWILCSGEYCYTLSMVELLVSEIGFKPCFASSAALDTDVLDRVGDIMLIMGYDVENFVNLLSKEHMLKLFIINDSLDSVAKFNSIFPGTHNILMPFTVSDITNVLTLDLGNASSDYSGKGSIYEANSLKLLKPRISSTNMKVIYPDKYVLIVDDNKINLRVATRLLGNLGLNVITATSAEQAMEILEEQNFDLIFMDIQMPDIDGMEALRMIRKREADMGLKPNKVVALTADTSEQSSEMYKAQGMLSVLGKPLNRTAIIDVLNKHIT